MNLLRPPAPMRTIGVFAFCVSVLCFQLVTFSAALAAESLLRDCTSRAASTANSVQCEVDVFDGQLVSRVAVTAIPGNQPIPARYVSNGPEDSPTSVAVLWGASSELEAANFNRLKAVISSTLNPNGGRISYGLWTYATDVRSIAPLGTSPTTIKLALDGIRPTGKTSELLRGINEVAKSMMTSPARRKVLIVLSDGTFDDTAYTVQELSDKLKSAGIRVFVVIPSRAPEAITAAQSLRRLADETDGIFLTAYNQDSEQKAAQAIKAHVEGSGAVAFAVPESPARVDVFLTNNKVLSGVFDPPPRLPVPDNSTVPENKLVEAAVRPETWSRLLYRNFNDAVVWTTETRLRIALVAAAASALALALGGVWLWLRRSNIRRRQLAADQSKSQEGSTISDMRPILGWLEFFDTSETKEPIRTKVTRIGRQNDNDLIIQNSTVHRHHALLKQELSGAFSILDLETANGVLLNGAQVKSGKLSDGDTIELGEVRMRFRVS